MGRVSVKNLSRERSLKLWSQLRPKRRTKNPDEWIVAFLSCDILLEINSVIMLKVFNKLTWPLFEGHILCINYFWEFVEKQHPPTGLYGRKT
jgi:hypothetical protein